MKKDIQNNEVMNAVENTEVKNLEIEPIMDEETMQAIIDDNKIIAMDKYIDETFNELMGNPTWHYYVRGGVMHLIERSDIIEIEISDIIQKRIVNHKS